MERRQLLSTITWAADVSGDWDNATMWTGGALPGHGDDAVIPFADITVTHAANTSDSVNSLTSDAAIALSGGSLSVANASALHNSFSLLPGAALSGSGDVTVAGLFDWQGGTLSGPAGTNLTANGGITIDSPASKTLDGRSLTNQTTATWTGGDIGISNYAALDNPQNAYFDDEVDATLYNLGFSLHATFNNAGTFIKSAGSGQAALVATLNNSGTITVKSGTLFLSNNYTVGPSNNTGVFSGDPGTTLHFYNVALAGAAVTGDVVLFDHGSNGTVGAFSASSTTIQDGGNGPIAFTGPISHVGPLIISGATAIFDSGVGSPLALDSLTLDGNATLTGTDSFVVTGPVDWTDGTLAGPTGSSLTALGGIALAEDPSITTRSLVLDGRTLNNGDAAHTAVICDFTSGQVYLSDDAAFDNYGAFNVVAAPYNGSFAAGSLDAAFYNYGTFTKTGAASSEFMHYAGHFNNAGSVLVQQGGLSLSQPTNSGTVTVDAGATVTASGYTQDGGATVLAGGTLAGGPFNINAGLLSGTGTINGDLNSSGQVSPGGANATGTLNVDGNYTQNAAGGLDIELAGSAAGQCDLLAVSGTASLAGGLNISLIGGEQPAVGDAFPVLTYGARSGRFNALTGTALGQWRFLDPVYSATSLTLATDQVAIVGAPATSPEGTQVAVSGAVTGASASDPSRFSYAWTVTKNGNPFAAGTGQAYVFVPDDNGSYAITLAVSDADGGQCAAPGQMITVFNVAPTASVTGDANGVRGQSRSFSVSATDPSPVDTAAGFTYAVNWGDGTSQTVNPGQPTTLGHVFTASGTYTVTATATDKDGGTRAAVTQSILIEAVELQTDPADKTKTALVVGGTTGNDNIVYNPGGGGQVVLNGVNLGRYAPTGHIIIYGQAGDDTIQVAGGITLPTILFGGDGNDTITGDNGNNIIVGGAGNDTIAGGNGRDLLIGGTGADSISGNGGDDILIGGATTHDNDPAALCAIMNEWASADTYATRVSVLTAPNGLLADGQVLDDLAANVLTGGSGQDFFIVGVQDSITDLATNETKKTEK